MMDWNDLRHFLAVARTGSTIGAGRRLRVSQTTAARRIAALEADLGTILFDRRPSGYRLTESGRALIDKAEAMEKAAEAFADAAAIQKRSAEGIVRLTVDEIYAVTLLGPLLRAFHEANPDIRIALDTTEEKRDLASGEADIALRLVDRPAGAGLVGRRLATENWTICCSREYASVHGCPKRQRDLARHAFVGGGGPGLSIHYRAWLERNGLADRVAMEHGSSTGLLSAVRSGVGLAVLPILVARQEPDLIICLPPDPDHERGLWLLTHERLRSTPRVRTLLDFLASRLGELFRGQMSPE